jgi:hypothetical protein
VLVCLLAAVGLSGCSHSSQPLAGGYVSQTSIPNVLYNLKLAFYELNLEEYASLLDDDFRHLPDRRNEGPDLPWVDETWGKEEEIERIRGLFNGEPNINGQIVGSVRLNFSAGATERSWLDPGWFQVVLDPIRPVVMVTEEASGDEWLLQGLRLHPWILHLVQTEEQVPETGERIWRIIRREEMYTSNTVSWDEYLEEIRPGHDPIGHPATGLWLSSLVRVMFAGATWHRTGDVPTLRAAHGAVARSRGPERAAGMGGRLSKHIVVRLRKWNA